MNLRLAAQIVTAIAWTASLVLLVVGTVVTVKGSTDVDNHLYVHAAWAWSIFFAAVAAAFTCALVVRRMAKEVHARTVRAIAEAVGAAFAAHDDEPPENVRQIR